MEKFDFKIGKSLVFNQYETDTKLDEEVQEQDSQSEI
jgi:hypothetical protein